MQFHGDVEGSDETSSKIAGVMPRSELSKAGGLQLDRSLEPLDCKAVPSVT
jgi:hypothetical protein